MNGANFKLNGADIYDDFYPYLPVGLVLSINSTKIHGWMEIYNVIN